MNWDTLLEWTPEDWEELGRLRLHHPNCKDTEPIPEGYTPYLTHGGARITWKDAQSHFGPQCTTGLKTSKPKRSGDVGEMEEVLERLAKMPDDEAIKRELATLTMKQLAGISTGRGAQQLRALELISDMAKVGLGTPRADDPEQCPVGRGEADCPVCGGRHQAQEVYVSDKLWESLQQLEEVTGEEMARGTNKRRIDVKQ